MLHGLGGSARAWDGVIAALDAEFEAAPIDLPGFGEARDATDLGVADMADQVAAIVRQRAAARWLLVGHSMGGKIASIVAARALAGEPGLFGLAGVVLLAGSPPSPEPMDEDKRREMIGWAAGGPLDAAAAQAFVAANVAAPLDPVAQRLTIDDLERSSRQAWLAWLERGSREDWSIDVGTLKLPALIIVGSADGELGEAGQHATNALVYPRASIVVENNAAHLLHLERPREVARHIGRFWHQRAGISPAMPEEFVRLVGSARVSRRMRAALATRAIADDPDYLPGVLSPAQLKTLRALADRVLPQTAPAIDLAARIDAQLATGQGDGWRFADMPPDRTAYALALDGLDGFGDLPEPERQARLSQLESGGFGLATLSAQQMQHWFEDLRADLVRIWVAHPATMARMGFDGFANGGDGVRKQGFELLAAGEREPWEALAEMPR
ncbi:alpha/beta fold hydrolase [Xylophilus rhododendri]|uniref:Alpha/beta fold hydrolase n=1 Tax=Xylophilus rhododendri TaxID=2697032 RepID=A0A857J0Q1_9BURK|nr:alpha/beta hydrolase [Xylophilus rhododendri]QHI97440.1 alpha/beta fold hydrolase [Xylophilus rhododendri]